MLLSTEMSLATPFHPLVGADSIRRAEDLASSEYFRCENIVIGKSRKQIMELASLAFVERAENVVFLGPSGVGKTPSQSRSDILLPKRVTRPASSVRPIGY